MKMLDTELEAICVATGNSYSLPVAPTSDAVVALGMETGEIRWVRKVTGGDVWNGSCQPRALSHANCPDDNGPDFDFGSSPNLVDLGDGWRLLTVGQKSGIVYGFDPDNEGAIVSGMFFTNSGYSPHAGVIPGKVFLALGIE